MCGSVVFQLCGRAVNQCPLQVDGPVDRILLVVIPGLSPEVYARWSGELRALAQFDMAHTLRLPGNAQFLYVRMILHPFDACVRSVHKTT